MALIVPSTAMSVVAALTMIELAALPPAPVSEPLEETDIRPRSVESVPGSSARYNEYDEADTAALKLSCSFSGPWTTVNSGESITIVVEAS